MDEMKVESLTACRCGVTEKDHDEGSPMLELDGSDDGLWRVLCHGCGMNSGWHLSEDVAVSTWNRQIDTPYPLPPYREVSVDDSQELHTVGWKWLNNHADGDICFDRSCFRCRLADVLFELEKKYPHVTTTPPIYLGLEVKP